MCEDGVVTALKRYSPERRERAGRTGLEHDEEYASQWDAIRSTSEKIGCAAGTSRRSVRQADPDEGGREGCTSDER